MKNIPLYLIIAVLISPAAKAQAEHKTSAREWGLKDSEKIALNAFIYHSKDILIKIMFYDFEVRQRKSPVFRG